MLGLIYGVAFASAADIRVVDFGARGDGKHDDGPALVAAFKAAKDDGLESRVVFEKKIYRLGDHPNAWHCLSLIDHENLIIDGNGATLICGDASLAFHIKGGRNITLRGMAFDTDRPSFTQGEVIAVDNSGTLDVKISDSYPEPPDEAFLRANKYEAHGGGGRHMIVFENGGFARNTRMGNDHLYIHNITRISPGVFRFHVKDDYVPSMKGIAVGNCITYGLNKVQLPAAVVAAKNRSASIYGQIAADHVENITFEKLDFFGSLNGGIRVSDMHGDVTLRQVRMIRKPSSGHFLSMPSDALHLMNIRGKLLIENCHIEAPGDDCLNVGTLLEKIVDYAPEVPNAMTLTTTDNHYYYYTIRKGDALQFLDTKANRVIGVANVKNVEFIAQRRSHRIVLDRALPALVPANVVVLNLNQMTSSTVIRNNVMTPYMRNAMLVRAQNMTIEGNKFDGSHGGVMGLNFTYSMGESARMRNVNITGNTFSGFQSSAIIMANAYRDQHGVLEAQDFSITNNSFQLGSGKAMRVRGVLNLSLSGNRWEKQGKPVEEGASFLEIIDCMNVMRDVK